MLDSTTCIYFALCDLDGRIVCYNVANISGDGEEKRQALSSEAFGLSPQRLEGIKVGDCSLGGGKENIEDGPWRL